MVGKRTIGIAGASSLMLGLVSSSAGSAHPGRILTYPVRGAVRAAMRRPLERSRYGGGPAPCMTSAPTNSFVGVGINENDDATGPDSAVAAGQLNEVCDDDSVDFGGEYNGISNAGTAYSSAVASGYANGITANTSFVGAGQSNLASGTSSFVGAAGKGNAAGAGSVILGGDNEYTAFATSHNFGIQVSGIDAFAGAGDLGAVSGNGSVLGSGNYTFASNSQNITPGTLLSGVDAFLGAGDQNALAATDAFLGSGQGNDVESPAGYGALLGGKQNVLSGGYGSVLGGYANDTAGVYATVAGGDGNTAAGEASFVAGYHANDLEEYGTFLWSDFRSGSAPLEPSAPNQFLIRASGGITLYSSEAMTGGVTLPAGSGAWSSLSDRDAKSHIVPLDDASVLAKVSGMAIDSWSYESEIGVRHAGPMAQDFYAAFRAGEDSRHITSIDEDGVTLSAIKALHGENARLHSAFERSQRERLEKDARIAELSGDVRTLDAMVGRLVARRSERHTTIHSSGEKENVR